MSRRTWIVACALIALPAIGAGIYWFQPHKLVLDDRVAETAPAAAQRVVGEGAFRSLEHETTGRARLLAAPDGSLTLWLEDLRTSNGPQLVAMLSSTPATEDGWSAYDDGEVLKLAPLKGNLGTQSYAVPPGTDLARFRSAVVWCDRFSVAFGAAPLATPAEPR